MIDELIETCEQLTRVSGPTASDNILSLGADALQALELMREIAGRFRAVVPHQAQDRTRTIAQRRAISPHGKLCLRTHSAQ